MLDLEIKVSVYKLQNIQEYIYELNLLIFIGPNSNCDTGFRLIDILSEIPHLLFYAWLSFTFLSKQNLLSYYFSLETQLSVTEGMFWKDEEIRELIVN